MMNQGATADSLATLDSSSVEKHQGADSSQPHTSSYYVPAGSTEASWTTHGADNFSRENGSFVNSSYHHDQRADPALRNAQDGLNMTSVASGSISGGATVTQDYGNTNYTSTDPYGYTNTGYAAYYNGYQQPSSHSYSQPVGAYQNTGAPYQPLSSFQNTGSYAGPASYSSTYYNHGDYQTSGGYTSGVYNSQTNLCPGGQYTSYTSHQYPNYTPDSNAGYNSAGDVAAFQYQQHHKQWVDYYSQTQSEVSCAPGTENISVSSASTLSCPVPSLSSGCPAPTSQPPAPYTPSWRPESSSAELPSLQPVSASGGNDDYWKHIAQVYQNHQTGSSQPNIQKPVDANPPYGISQYQQNSTYPEVPATPYEASYQVPQCYQSSLQPASSNVPPLDSPRVSSSSQPNILKPVVANPPYEISQYQQNTTYPQVPTTLYAASHQVPKSYQSSLQPVSSNFPPVDSRRISKMQIPTNPRIASSLTLGLPNSDKEVSTTTASAKPAYVSVSLPKSNDKTSPQDAADSVLKPGMFPKSLRGYVERALARCKDDTQMAASQAVMKEIITKATADGTLYSKDWDTEPLFALPIMDTAYKESSLFSTPVSSNSKRSPNRRTKSRWEPVVEEKSVDKPASITNETPKYGGWNKQFSDGKSENRDDLSTSKYSFSDQKTPNRDSQRPAKRQRFGDGLVAGDNGEASSDSDKEQTLTAYYSAAMALADSPEERKRRENRSKRFDKGHGNRAQKNHFRPKSKGTGSLYTRRATALVLSKNFEESGSRAVEDIDWDALTVKGTCQEIEKRFLRLTSAPDPATVRPEEVLEKALDMVQNSEKNYLYKCDQLKSIRQDLTVQRIRNELTVKVYETHARLAIEVGDLAEYNQCQSQLQTLYAEGIKGCQMEFAAYHLLCVILHSNNNRDLLSAMSRLSAEARKNEAVKHALAVRAAVTSGNYVLFFRLYKTAPNLNTWLMDRYVEKMRYAAVRCMSHSCRPTVPVSYIAQVLGFCSTTEANSEDIDGVEECVEWLKAHGACLTSDNSGEMLLDAKASIPSLYIPEPEDAVAHGDANLAVNDFLARQPV